jgi:hypothetical protein
MDRLGIARALLSPPPHLRSSRRVRLADLRAAVHREPRLAFAAGGESLNPILQATPAAGVSTQLLHQFTALAEEIAGVGAASFGELAAEHFSSGRGRHPCESSPPDHPLLLALADVAARRGMPIDLHMEAVPRNMAFPPERAQGPNPDRLTANIAPLERLLDHNRAARIVWLHAGWDLTAERTVALMRGLLERHANLAMSIKYDHGGARQTAPFLPQESDLRPGWIAMLHEFPDRFMIGRPDLTARIASDNAKRIYRLGTL